jgi:ABC-type transporter Mla subunit MlaD
VRRVLIIAGAILAATALIAFPAVGADDGPYKVRAIFDNGSFVANDMEVRVAGATIGTIDSVDVTGPDEIASLEGGPHPVPGKAVVVMNITDDGFKDFRQDASCIIRPQSLIGEKLIDCTPTQPRAAGQEPPPELEKIEEGPGEGQYLLPLENNGKTVDLDLIQNINRASYRDRFRLILNDLGAGLAARGDDLAEVVDRANPALRQTNRVLKILADQNDTLAQLASDGDTVLEPLARNRTSITGFFRNAGVSGQAAAERGDDIEAGLAKFPETLRQVRATMVDLRAFADQGTPLATDIGASAKDISRATQKLVPFAKNAVPAFTSLGDALEQTGPLLVQADPLLVDLVSFSTGSTPVSKNLSALLSTFEETKGFQHLSDFLFNSAGATNVFDTLGHMVRSNVQVSNCINVEAIVVQGCEAAFSLQNPSASSSKDKKAKVGDGGVRLLDPPSLDEVLPEVVPDPGALRPPTETVPEEEETTTPDEDGEGDGGDTGEEEGEGSGDAGSGADSSAGSDPDREASEDGLTPEERKLLAEALAGEREPGQLSMKETRILLRFLLGGTL